MATTAHGSVDESARRRFEAAWREGKPEPVERFLPPEGDPRFSATLEEIVFIELELAWKRSAKESASSGERTGPLVEQYLARFPCLNQRDFALRLLRHEFLVRQHFGDRPKPAEYQARFPHLVPTGSEVETLTDTDKSKPPPVPTIPGYEILDELGHGGMGVVYKARHRVLNRLVALKMILSARIGKDELGRFRTEAEAVAQMSHPNIAQIYEVGENEGRPFCTLEFVEGGNLAQKIAGTPQPARTAAAWMEQIAKAAHSAHERGIIHRDLKPANILMTEAGVPKITDFGLAKRLHGAPSQTQSDVVVGTPSYMSPEQATYGNVPIGPAADVYGLGAVLYELLTGRPPFKGESSYDTIHQVLNSEPVPPTRLQSKVPRDLETICLTCLHKQPRRRYATADELADDLGRYLRGEPIVARPVGWVEKTIKLAKRRPAAAGLVATLVLMVVGGVTGLFAWQHSEQRRLRTEYEFEQSQQQEEHRRAENLVALRRGAVADENYALQELHAGRFDTAEKLFGRAVKALSIEPLLAEQRTQLAAKRDRAKRLAEFYRFTDRAEWLAFLDADSEALAACRACLKSIGVPQHGKDWPNHLPSAELEGAQREQLHKDVNAAIMLWMFLRAKQGLVLTLKPGSREEDRARAKSKFQGSLDLLAMVEDSGRWQLGRLADFVCRHYLKMEQSPQVAKDAPFNGYDFYAMGIVHLWVAKLAMSGEKSAAELDPLAQAIIKIAIGGYGGLDLRTPRESAETMLRKSTELEQQHYWSHFWLGWSYLAAKPPVPHAAEMAFSKCIEIRPGFGFGFAERGRARILLRGDAPNTPLGKELQRRGLEDIQQALRLSPTEPYIHWLHAEIQFALRQPALVLKECVSVVELEAPLRALDGRTVERNTSTSTNVKSYLVERIKQDATEVASQAVLAHACWVLDQEEAALEAASKALETDPQQPRALAVRGAVLFRRGQTKEALRDFDAALRQVNTIHLALVGQALALEAAGRHAEALDSYKSLLKDDVARPDWQLLEAYRGQSRTLMALGRDEEARAVLAQAERILPGFSDEVTKK